MASTLQTPPQNILITKEDVDRVIALGRILVLVLSEEEVQEFLGLFPIEELSQSDLKQSIQKHKPKGQDANKSSQD